MTGKNGETKMSYYKTQDLSETFNFNFIFIIYQIVNALKLSQFYTKIYQSSMVTTKRSKSTK